MTKSPPIIDNLLQVLLSNGFPRLRICTTFDIGVTVTFSDTWAGSATLHTLNLTIRDPVHQEKLRLLCPRLRRLTTDEFPMDGFFAVPGSVREKRIFRQIRKLDRLESENKIIIDVNPLAFSGNQKVPPRFNNTTIIERLNTNNIFTFQVRILPQSKPYCRASFLIEIAFPPEYPFKITKIMFLDPIYHPCVYELGTLSSGGEFRYNYDLYKPTTSLVEVIEKVLYFIDNIPGQPKYVNEECFKEYTNDYPTFFMKAWERTLSYGRARY